MGRLTTHVLDTVHGRPAAGMAVELWRLGADGVHEQVAALTTNADGRAPAPLLEGDTMQPGEYELRFAVRAYFAGLGVASPFLHIVPVCFTLYDTDQHYHVPLLVSPWAYSTYRGS